MPILTTNPTRYASPLRDYIYLVLLLVTSVLVLHLFTVLREIFFIIAIILFLITKKDYLWLCFMFIFMQSPGGLYTYAAISFLKLSSTVSIPFTYIFILVAFLKFRFIFPRKNNLPLLYKSIRLIPLYIIFLIGLSVLYGISAKSFAFIFYSLSSLVLFWLVPYFLPDRATLIKFLRVLFFAVILLFIWQLRDIIFPIKLHTYFKKSEISGSVPEDFELVRIFYAAGVSLLSLLASLYFLLQKKESPFQRNYLYLIVIVSFGSIFLTATRGYIIQYLFILLIFIFLSPNRSLRLLTYVLIISFMMIMFFPVFQKQIVLVFERLGTLSSLYQGDETAQGTLIRITERAPKVWNEFIKNPVFGWGFSNSGVTTNDDHVGNYTLLLQGGVMGVFLYLVVILLVISALIRKFFNTNNRKNAILIIAFIFSLIIAHSTSSTVFTFYFEPPMAMIFALLLSFIQLELYKKQD